MPIQSMPFVEMTVKPCNLRQDLPLFLLYIFHKQLLGTLFLFNWLHSYTCAKWLISYGTASVGSVALYALRPTTTFEISVGWKASQNEYWVMFWHGVLRGTHRPVSVSASQHGASETTEPEIQEGWYILDCPLLVWYVENYTYQQMQQHWIIQSQNSLWKWTWHRSGWC